MGEAVGVECHVGVEHSGPVHQAGGRRRRRLLRAARAVLHPSLGCAEPHRRDGGGQGPAQRREEPASAPAPARHHAGEGDGVPDAVGPDPFRRDLPVLRRRLRAGDRRRAHRRRARRRRPPRRMDPRHRDAHRAAGLLRPRPGQPAGRSRRRRGAVEGGRDHQPDRRDRRRRDLRAVLVVRADVAGEPRVSRPRARAGSSPRRARPRSAGGYRSTRPAGCSRPIPLARRA